MNTKKTPQEPDDSPKKPNIFRYAVKFTKNLLKDNYFWSRFNGIPNGVVLIAEGVAGILFLTAALPLAVHTATFAGCCALAGIGLSAIGYGFVNAWKSMESLCSRTFPQFNPLSKIRLCAQSIAQAISAIPPVRALHDRLEKIKNKIVQRPLAQKFLKSRLGRRLSHGPTQNQQDVFLAAVTVQGSTAFAIGASIAMASYVAAMPAITAGSIFTLGALGMAWGAYEVVDCCFSVVSSARTLVQIYRGHKNAKPSAEKESVAKPVIAASHAWEPTARPVFANATPAFNKEAGKEASFAAIPALAHLPGQANLTCIKAIAIN